MVGPVQVLRRALLPLDCCSGDGRGGAAGGVGAGAGFIAAAVAAAAGGGSGSGGGNAIHESLVKVLLRVDCIQPEVGLSLALSFSTISPSLFACEAGYAGRHNRGHHLTQA